MRSFFNENKQHDTSPFVSSMTFSLSEQERKRNQRNQTWLPNFGKYGYG